MGLSLDPLPGVQMAQLQKSLLATLLLVLLSSSFTSAGFVSPGNSIYVGTSPTLRYLLACGHLATKPPYLSTHENRWQRGCATSRLAWVCHRQELRGRRRGG